ncbi:MAG: Uncharacterised protein [Opitutia bacterium UBA7350]|nr:MAG: Uncharacterised protein [Opitutae bacterium UBA7350]
MNQGNPSDKGGKGERGRRSSRRHRKKRSYKKARRPSLSTKSPRKRSIFSNPSASKAPIQFSITKNKEPLVGREFIYALLGISGLIFFGGGAHVWAQGFALVLTGIMLIKHPPRGSLGPWFNVGAILFLIGGMTSFLPGGLGFQPEWREVGVRMYGINLPSSSTVHLRQGLEIFILLCACLCWFYALSQLRINLNGRKWVLFWISVFSLCLGGAIVLGECFGWTYPGSPNAEHFSFFANPTQMGWLLLLCGIYSFAYGMEGLANRNLDCLMGLPAAALCVTALALGHHFTALLMFFVGIGIYCGLRIWSADIKIRQKLSISVLLYGILIFSLNTEGGLVELTKQVRLPLKAWQMFAEAPLAGVGLGSFSKVLVYYYDAWQAGIFGVNQPNDFMLVACSMGVLGLSGFIIMLFVILKRMQLTRIMRVGSLRLVPLLACLIYLLAGFSGEARHALAVVYFILLLLALSFPLKQEKKRQGSLLLWRTSGYIFLFIGGLWMLAVPFRMPTHSKLILKSNVRQYQQAKAEGDLIKSSEALNRLIELESLNWYWYHLRAKEHLKVRNYARAEEDFKRALFVEPYLTSPAFLAGEAWFGHRGVKAESAWHEALRRSGRHSRGLFKRMAHASMQDVYRASVLLNLSRKDPKFAAILMELAEKDIFLQELKGYMEADPSLGQFSRLQRTKIIFRWIRMGEYEGPASFMEAYSSKVDMAWYLQSYVYQNGARFEDALNLLRSGLRTPSLPSGEVEPSRLALLERDLASKPSNFEAGFQLISVYLAKGAYQEGLFLIQRLLQDPAAPPELYYWQAECYLRQGNLVDGWLSLETYAQGVLNLQR